MHGLIWALTEAWSGYIVPGCTYALERLNWGAVSCPSRFSPYSQYTHWRPSTYSEAGRADRLLHHIRAHATCAHDYNGTLASVTHSVRHVQLRISLVKIPTVQIVRQRGSNVVSEDIKHVSAHNRKPSPHCKVLCDWDTLFFPFCYH